MLEAKDLQGVLAIMPTPARDGADSLDAVDTVDLDETARLAESLVRDGVAGIMVLGTMGECATVSRNDYEAYVTCLLETVRGRVPTFVGTTALGGHEIAQRIRFVKDRGATGTLLASPCGSRRPWTWRCISMARWPRPSRISPSWSTPMHGPSGSPSTRISGGGW